MARSIAEKSIASQMIQNRLVALRPGELVEYAELSRLAGMDVQSGPGRARLATARRAVERDERIVVDAVFGKGIKRLANDEIPAIGAKAIKHINRTAARSEARLGNIVLAESSESAKDAALAAGSILAATRSFTSRAATDRVRKAVENGKQYIGSDELLRLVGAKK